MKTHVPNLDTFADLIDRLIVCVNKLAWFENKKRETQTRLNKLLDKPDVDSDQEAIDLAVDITNWDNASRNECEIRNILKRAIDEKLVEVLTSGEYKVLPDFRTFAPPKTTVSDILASQCEEIGEATKIKMKKEFGV